MPDPFMKGGIYEKRVMLSVWWGVYGIYRFELLPDNTTVTAEVYCAQLQRLADKIHKEHPKLDKAVELGLSAQPFTKTSLSPGSRVVTKYLKASGLLPYLQRLGLHIAGYGCMTCIGNSGPLDAEVSRIIEEVFKRYFD
ncbi:hypothetical protein RB195_022285 [Necator americanus]|uniref:Aconitase/3-isopropylmalate dehydratase large subunit alpha/beta/alpha domain-containing protein n=1 Tax=Necator americanus TaxID=51031 RepID=A0ABR1EFP6_NECAM